MPFSNSIQSSSQSQFFVSLQNYYQNRFNLKRHRIGVHSGPNGQFQCEICAKSFHYQSNLTRHRKDEHKSGPGFPGTQVVVHPSHKVVKQKHPALLAIGASNGGIVSSPSATTPVVSTSSAHTKVGQRSSFSSFLISELEKFQLVPLFDLSDKLSF